jgi:CelD/BcsL family acetyltransferase involved in cellulose biosynthesis
MGDAGRFELERFTTLHEARAVWPDLAEQSGNLFASWEWISTWWRHFGHRRDIAGIIARRPQGSAAAILPMYLFVRRPVRVLRFLGHGPGDWLGPIHAPDDTELAAAALRAALATLTDWDVLFAEHLRADQLSSDELGGTLIRREGFPMLPFRRRSWEQLLADHSANFRQQVRRRERKLRREHRLSYRLTTDPGRLDGDLELLFKLHAARWHSGASHAFTGPRRSFHREFAQLALARGWLRLWTMQLDGTPVAVWYGFRYDGIEWYYQAGRDPARDYDSVGFVLLCHTIRAALEDGAHAYWFLRGGEAYKNRFAEDDSGVETVAVANGVRGHGAIAAARGLDRLPDAGRRWVRARLG